MDESIVAPAMLAQADEESPAQKMARMRWERCSKAERSEHAHKMLDARWGKKKGRPKPTLKKNKKH